MTKMLEMARYGVGLIVILLWAAVALLMAQTPPGMPSAPPEPAQISPEEQPLVARVSVIEGSVSTQRGDSGEWVALTPNTPLVAGDSISTGPGARAEVQLDYANVLRLSDGAAAKIAVLAPNQIQVQVWQGLVNYSIVRPGEAAVEIQTPNAAVHPTGLGSYRIFVEPEVETRVAVRNGAAEVATPQGGAHVDRGQLIRIQGIENAQYQTTYAPALDDWDRWNSERDRLIANSEGVRRTTPYYAGVQDLDPYGRWENASDYGNVWVPEVGPDWAPYRAGRWVWEPYYGWTWVSYEPWGWAPYHYGRWFLYGARWVWWPGPVSLYPYYRPLWAPAYVSFFGFGRGVSFGVGFGFGNIGWLPIGPADFFFPWYGRFGNRVNIVGARNIYGARGFNYGGVYGIRPLSEHGFSNMHEAFRNDRVRAGMTSMAGSQFGRSGIPIHQQPISAASLQQGGLMTGRLGMSPSRESYRPTDRVANPVSIPSRTSQRFFSDSRYSGAMPQSSWRGNQGNPVAGPRGQRPTPGSSPSGWQSPQPRGGEMNGSASTQGASPPSGAQRGAPPSISRPFPSYGNRQGGYPYGSSRPPLDLRQSIVTPRGSSEGSAAPRYSGPTPRYSTPSGSPYGAPSAPRYNAPSVPRYSTPSADYGNGPRGAPPSVGRGSYSAPSRSGGGGRPGGGHSSARGR